MSQQRCKVYLVALTEEAPLEYETPAAMVIVDTSPGAARATAADRARQVAKAAFCGDYDHEMWIKAATASCKGIGYAFKSYRVGEVLYVDINHG